MNILENLEKLCTATAPSGFECNVAELAAEVLEPFVDEVYVDPMYNVVGVRRCGRENAKKLMEDSSLHIADISEMVGFADTAHFSRVFKKFTGMSANEYRNRFLR